ncbi:MAG: hypothetical protein ACJ8C4_05665 [Gemmataceae bacterium]
MNLGIGLQLSSSAAAGGDAPAFDIATGALAAFEPLDRSPVYKQVTESGVNSIVDSGGEAIVDQGGDAIIGGDTVRLFGTIDGKYDGRFAVNAAGGSTYSFTHAPMGGQGVGGNVIAFRNDQLTTGGNLAQGMQGVPIESRFAFGDGAANGSLQMHPDGIGSDVDGGYLAIQAPVVTPNIFRMLFVGLIQATNHQPVSNTPDLAGNQDGGVIIRPDASILMYNNVGGAVTLTGMFPPYVAAGPIPYAVLIEIDRVALTIEAWGTGGAHAKLNGGGGHADPDAANFLGDPLTFNYLITTLPNDSVGRFRAFYYYETLSDATWRTNASAYLAAKSWTDHVGL